MSEPKNKICEAVKTKKLIIKNSRSGQLGGGKDAARWCGASARSACCTGVDLDSLSGKSKPCHLLAATKREGRQSI